MNNKKITVIVLVVLSIGLVISALYTTTYALFSVDAYGENPNDYSTGLLSIVANSKSENISLTSALPMTDDEGKQTTPYVFTIKNIGNLDYEFDVKLLSTGSNTFSPQYIKLQIDDGEVTTLSALTSGIIKSAIVLSAGETLDISIRAWLSIDTPNSEIGKTFESKIVTDGQAVYTASNNEVLLTSYLLSLYNNANKTTVTNNSIAYNYATSVSLMNDRLGGTTGDLNAGNIRYYGANPNNYIDIGDVYENDVEIGNWVAVGGPFSNSTECYAYFEDDNLIDKGKCEDATSCQTYIDNMVPSMGFSSVDELCDVTITPAGTPILYRVIGLFKDVELSDGTKQDLVKIVRNESIGAYSWDTSSSDVNGGYGINEWSQADLMKLLNPEYENETVGGSLYYNSGSGTCYNGSNNTTISCDFTNTGLSSGVRSKIASVVWNLGGHNTNAVYSDQIYGYERGEKVVEVGTTCSGTYCNDSVTRTKKWPGKVALAYPSDYGYATDFTKCTGQLSSYNNTGCYDNDWLYAASGRWLLTPRSSYAHYAWCVNVDGYGYGPNVNRAYAAFPVLYLNSGLSIVSGNGSETNPYVIR